MIENLSQFERKDSDPFPIEKVYLTKKDTDISSLLNVVEVPCPSEFRSGTQLSQTSVR